MSILQNSQIEELMKNIKTIKSNIVYTNRNLVLGTDNKFATLRILNLKNNNEFPITAFEWNTINYNIKNNIPYNIYDKNIEYFILNKYNKVINIINNYTPVYSYQNINENDNFTKCISGKAAEGAFKFNIDGYIMYIYASLLNKNKSDLVDLNIYDLNNNKFLTEFCIHKKNATIWQYACYLKI